MGDARKIRRLEEADVPFAMWLKSAAGWNQTEDDWRLMLAMEPEGCFAAEVQDRPAGTAVALDYGGRIGWIGMVLVDPACRGQGVGTALLHRTIGYLQAKGLASIKLDATAAGRRIYEPLGFVAEYDVVRYTGTTPATVGDEETPPPTGTRIETLDWAADGERVVRLDAEIFGVSRAEVLAHPAYRQPDCAFAAHDADGELTGFLLVRAGTDAAQIGPWAARDAATAAALLGALFRRRPGTNWFVDVPEPNPAATAMIERAGFRQQRGFTRMVLGPNPHPGRPEQFYGTAGPELG